MRSAHILCYAVLHIMFKGRGNSANVLLPVVTDGIACCCLKEKTESCDFLSVLNLITDIKPPFTYFQMNWPGQS